MPVPPVEKRVEQLRKRVAWPLDKESPGMRTKRTAHARGEHNQVRMRSCPDCDLRLLERQMELKGVSV